MANARWPAPRRYVEALLLWQGAAWLGLATAGLILWLMTLPAAVASASNGTGELWRGGQLVAIAIGAGLGITEMTMACRMRPLARRRSALGVGVQGVTPGAGLVVIGISVLVAVSTVTLLG